LICCSKNWSLISVIRQTCTSYQHNFHTTVFTTIKSQGSLFSQILKSFRELHSHTLYSTSDTICIIWWVRGAFHETGLSPQSFHSHFISERTFNVIHLHHPQNCSWTLWRSVLRTVFHIKTIQTQSAKTVWVSYFCLKRHKDKYNFLLYLLHVRSTHLRI
jgi:hypothetical protein